MIIHDWLCEDNIFQAHVTRSYADNLIVLKIVLFEEVVLPSVFLVEMFYKLVQKTRSSEDV